MDIPAGSAEQAIGDRAAPRRRHDSARPPGASSGRSDVIARKPPDPAAKPATRRRARPDATLAEAAKSPGTPRKKAAVAGPRARAQAPPPPSAAERLDKVQAVIVGSLEDDKAEEVVTIDLAGRAAFADRMVIATGLADRQISAMATHLEEKLADWVLIDAGDIVIHLFKPDARALYALEKMWGAELDEPGEQSTA
jgi:ribosome silencing factor RsfS/YbeB/iojap